MKRKACRWEFLALGALAGGVPCAVGAGPALADGIGSTPGNPVEACRPDGARRYLERLECPSGGRVLFSRIGSMGPRTAWPTDVSEEQALAMLAANMAAQPLAAGEADHHIVDGYEVVCDGGKTLLYVDAYHCDSPPTEEAPAGFRIAP